MSWRDGQHDAHVRTMRRMLLRTNPSMRIRAQPRRMHRDDFEAGVTSRYAKTSGCHIGDISRMMNEITSGGEEE